MKHKILIRDERCLQRGIFCCVVCCMLAALCLVACSSREVAATFGNHTITEDEVTDYTASFRTQNDLTDDLEWANYLTKTREMTSEQWRQEVIRELADHMLIEDKAAEDGITADQSAIDAKIIEAKQNAGIDADDEQAWTDYLADQGQTPDELRETYEFSSIEEQVFEQEIDFTTELKDEMCDDYIWANLADQVVRHYAVISFDLDDKAGAQACLEELEALDGEALITRFDELAAQAATSTDAAAESGDIGWDFMYDESSIDPKLKLRNAKLAADTLYPKVLKGTDALRVVYCAERVELADTSYASLDSESLKSIISDLTLASNWTALCQEYLSNMEDAANIQVTEMPDDLPYDIVESDSSSSSADTEATDTSSQAD